ncbi:hypothetical protein C8R46DRAFT_1346640 [Mycena filopes]|nr:hypothetical protein C8R46DRAFT_1346640 [Mycena filopes]
MDATTMSTSADSIRTLQRRQSPQHSPDNSPPDSPSLSASGSSVSSFPSVNSSFFFSSAAASPPHGPTPLPVEETLIIPSLTLPALLIRPKQPQGPLTRLLVLGDPHRAAAALFLDNPDALDPSAWVYEDGLRVLRTSTAWRDPRDPLNTDHLNDDIHHSADDIERTNIELAALGEDVHQLDVAAIEDRILTPFRRIAALLAPPMLSSPPEEEQLLTALLTSPEAPLYTALLVVSAGDPSAPTSSSGVYSTVLSSASASASGLDSQVAYDGSLPDPPSFDHPSAVDVRQSTPSPADAIPDALRRLLPVLVLVPTPVAPPPAPCSEHEDDPHEPDDDPHDTTATDIPPPAPTPPTARPPFFPCHHRHTLNNNDNNSNNNYSEHTHTHTPASLRTLLRPGPAVRTLRVDAARRFARWWRAGCVDPYAHLHPIPPPLLALVPTTDTRTKGKGDARTKLRRNLDTYKDPNAAERVCYPPYASAGDPLHLPSLLALARDVLRASVASLLTKVGLGADKGEGKGGGWAPAFVAGVVVGVGVGVWCRI